MVQCEQLSDIWTEKQQKSNLLFVEPFPAISDHVLHAGLNQTSQVLNSPPRKNILKTQFKLTDLLTQVRF